MRQRVGQFRSGPVALRWRFLETLETDRLELGGYAVTQVARRHRLLVDDLVHRLQRTAAAERRESHEQLVQDAAKRMDVGRRTDRRLVPLCLLRGHVVW